MTGSLPRSPKCPGQWPLQFVTPSSCSEGGQHCDAHSILSGLLKTPGPWPRTASWPPLTTDRDTAFLSAHSRICGVAPGSCGTAVWIAAEVLLQVCPRMGGGVNSRREGCSGTCASLPSVSLLPILACKALTRACGGSGSATAGTGYRYG